MRGLKLDYLTKIGLSPPKKEAKTMGKKNGMTKGAAQRIQSHADKTGTNQGFKARAQRAASKKDK